MTLSVLWWNFIENNEYIVRKIDIHMPDSQISVLKTSKQEKVSVIGQEKCIHYLYKGL